MTESNMLVCRRQLAQKGQPAMLRLSYSPCRISHSQARGRKKKKKGVIIAHLPSQNKAFFFFSPPPLHLLDGRDKTLVLEMRFV